MGSEVIKFPTAAGVVVFGAAPTFRHLNPNVLLVKTDYWGFPKGMFDQGETLADTATRELLEETGARVNPDSLRSVGPTVHRYPYEGVNVLKTTHWFTAIIDPRELIITPGDEIEATKWLPWIAAMFELTYPQHRYILLRAALIQNAAASRDKIR
ncbi:hypothetical protein A2397_00225 [Candidatus Amesbacteria bacterium RIFOXYB1_FULL_44_23]|uniref:Nudix hydrolase domain-containing protein n=1 Tax=Candidatus Amesbacteria bacterium RIFOXYB1_FULL_44_23 TaxID=1797263 RepID=A0A1F4ZWG4_9BACT|nr:MAG: hypothetical protein A2397_00225 [Candidatus Amesbacteria bacterium RIFOXYB1_FULL_44_23]